MTESIITEFVDNLTGLTIRVVGKQELMGPSAERVEVLVGDEWHTLDDLGLECPCCGGELE